MESILQPFCRVNIYLVDAFTTPYRDCICQKGTDQTKTQHSSCISESVHYKQVTANPTAGPFNMYCPVQVAVSYNPKDISTFSTDCFPIFIRIFNSLSTFQIVIKNREIFLSNIDVSQDSPQATNFTYIKQYSNQSGLTEYNSGVRLPLPT
jgi:hypothetical protein